MRRRSPYVYAPAYREAGGKLIAAEEALIGVSEKYKDVILPGYTHMQRAQPVLFAHHMMAYCAMLQRDFERLTGCYEMADASPLGACALAGTTYPTMPKETAEKLHFSKCYGNSLDAVSDRDYLLQFLSFASICMMHLSRLSEELILWSTGEFGFIELDGRVQHRQFHHADKKRIPISANWSAGKQDGYMDI